MALARELLAYGWNRIANHGLLGVVHFMDPFIGFSSWDWSKRVTWLKIVFLLLAVSYESTSLAVMMFVEPDGILRERQFTMMFVPVTGAMCIVLWISLAVFRRDFSSIFAFLEQRQRVVHERHAPRNALTRKVTGYLWLFYLNNIAQVFFWINVLQDSSPLSIVNDPLVDVINVPLYPLAITLLSLMFIHTLTIVSTVLSAFVLEFYWLKRQFEDVFGAGSKSVIVPADAVHRRGYWNGIERRLRDCVIEHQTLMRQTSVLKEKLKPYFLLNLIIDFSLITFASCQMVMVRESDRYLYSILSILTASFNLLTFGGLCDLLKMQVYAIKFHLYSSRWTDYLRPVSGPLYQRYRRIRSSIHIVMTQAEHELRISCGGVYDMSLATCWAVLQFSYSAFTLLLSFFESPSRPSTEAA
ncbi:uncharacterized protein LOC118457055 [Anopheles albimanus]|uniref:Odorant receptor n=1 Tax=Anopheles albimanus TaxID=7167 RepID=A0A182G0G2_ANOAL|nr:uncharacterized protein LOC118457055 [Anopheles albimanus]